MNYPPKSTGHIKKQSPNNIDTRKSCSFTVVKPDINKPSHRRNVSNQFQPHHKKSVSSRNGIQNEVGHSSLIQAQRRQFVDDEESNFNVEEIDEAQQRSLTSEGDNYSPNLYNQRQYEASVYAAKYSYKSYLENQDMSKP